MRRIGAQRGGGITRRIRPNLHFSRIAHSFLSCLALRGQRGSLLLESALLVSIFGLVGMIVLGTVSTSYRTKNLFEVHSTSENIIRNQMEYVLEQPYIPPPATYSTIPVPAGYAVLAEALVFDQTNTNIETVRVSVLIDGRSIKAVDTLRSNR